MKNRPFDFWIYLARFYSGFLNAGMLLYISTMLTLHTGNLTRISIGIMEGNWPAIIFPSVAVISYFIGCYFTSIYYGHYPKGLPKEYWKGYLLVAILFIVLWILPEDGWAFIIIMSISMGIITSMPLTNRGYTGTITMLTGLITEIANRLSGWTTRQSKADKDQTIYLTINLVAYITGALIQTAHYMTVGIVRAWPLLTLAVILSFWAYRFGFSE